MNRPFELDPANWATLRRLLDTALDLAPAERGVWLAGLDPEHAHLKQRLADLLAHADDDSDGLRFATLPKVETGDFAPGLPDVQPGTPRSVGPYRLLRLLGEGGMGSVWLAERSDMLHGRSVALKLPRDAGRRPGLAERMVREREILAALTHPNIARLYDAGVGDDGQPYLAMEYVDGEPIDRFCAARSLDVAARLRLFLQVVNAVAHAHARLIVHRDLKPANILVTAQAEVRLLDFGIARLLDEGASADSALTELTGRAMTPDYAAPEQISGRPLGTAADVYSLGVVLYELLTGQRPYRLPAAHRHRRAALEEAILAVEPPRPSAAVGDAALRGALRGDLDTIVLKALKKAPEERYATADALAQDIERHRANEPVLARPDSRGYRARKFVARHRLAVGASSAIAVALMAGAGLAAWQAQRALTEQRHAQEVKDFIASILSEANPYAGQGRLLAAKDLLERARTRIDALGWERPEVRIELLNITGASLLGLGETHTAEGIARQAVEEAARRLRTAHPQALKARLLQVDVQRQRGQTAQMRPALAALIDELQRRPDEHAEALVRAFENTAHMEIDDGAPAKAVVAAQRAFDLARSRFGERDARSVAASSLLAESQQYETLTPQAALQAAERGLRFAESAHREQLAHPQVIHMREVYARSLSAHGEESRALEEWSRALRDVEVAFGPGSPLEGTITANMVPGQRRLGQVKAALANASRGLAILQQHVVPDSRTQGAHLTGRGVTWLAARRGAEALDDLMQASEVLAGSLGAAHADTLTARLNRALALAYAGRPQEAEVAVAPLVALYRAQMPQHLNYAYYVQGVTQRLAGRPHDALASQLQGLEVGAGGANADWQRLRVLPEIGLAQVDLGRHREAIESFDRALELLHALQTDASPTRAEASLGKGRALLGLSRPDEALVLLTQADAFWRGFDADNRWAGEAAYWLARCHDALARPAEAKLAFARAAEPLARSGLPGDAAPAREAARRR